jgi:hypothetical protein
MAPLARRLSVMWVFTIPQPTVEPGMSIMISCGEHAIFLIFHDVAAAGDVTVCFALEFAGDYFFDTL